MLGRGPEPLAAVRARIQRYLTTGDPAALLAPTALGDALACTTANSPEAAIALSKLHWYPYLHLPDGQDHDDYLAAWTLFGGIVDHALSFGWGVVEAAIASPRDAAWLNGLAARALRDGHGRIAVAGFTATSTVAAEDDPGGPGYLSNLGTALHTHHGRQGDVSLLRDAQAVHRTAVALTPITRPR